MNTDYQIQAIPSEVVAELRVRDDAGSVPEEVTHEEGGAPLRCCLRRAKPGERMLLASYAPLRRWAARTGANPGAYAENGPVFLHAEPCAGPDGGGDPPVAMHGPRRVLRAYSDQGRILRGTLLQSSGEDWTEVDGPLRALLADEQVAMVHIRTVEQGCFLMAAHRSAG
jgi:hypothetical protein